MRKNGRGERIRTSDPIPEQVPILVWRQPIQGEPICPDLKYLPSICALIGKAQRRIDRFGDRYPQGAVGSYRTNPYLHLNRTLLQLGVIVIFQALK
jgi:hypothetical protein